MKGFVSIYRPSDFATVKVIGKWISLLNVAGSVSLEVKDGKMIWTKKRQFYSTFCSILVLSAFAFFAWSHVSFGQRRSKFSAYLDIFQDFVFFFVPFALDYFMYSKIKNWNILIHNFSNLETYLSRPKFIKVKYKYLLLLPIYTTLTFYLYFFKMSIYLAIQIPICFYTIYVSFTIVSAYGEILKLIIQFFQDLTKGIKYKNKDSNKLMSMVDLVENSCKQTSIIFGDVFLFMLFSCFLLITSDVYYLICNFNRNYFITVERFAWVYFYIILVGSISHYSAKASNKANEFNDALYRTIMADKHDVFSRNFKVSAHLANNKTAVFTACGWFTIDYTTSCSMIATSATYLIILLQMGGTDLGKKAVEN